MKPLPKPHVSALEALGFSRESAPGPEFLPPKCRLSGVCYDAFDEFHAFCKPNVHMDKMDMDYARKILLRLQDELERQGCTASFHSIRRPARLQRNAKGAVQGEGPQRG